MVRGMRTDHRMSMRATKVTAECTEDDYLLAEKPPPIKDLEAIDGPFPPISNRFAIARHRPIDPIELTSRPMLSIKM